MRFIFRNFQRNGAKGSTILVHSMLSTYSKYFLCSLGAHRRKKRCHAKFEWLSKSRNKKWYNKMLPISFFSFQLIRCHCAGRCKKACVSRLHLCPWISLGECLLRTGSLSSSGVRVALPLPAPFSCAHNKRSVYAQRHNPSNLLVECISFILSELILYRQARAITFAMIKQKRSTETKVTWIWNLLNATLFSNEIAAKL